MHPMNMGINAANRFMPGASLANIPVASKLFCFNTMKPKTVVITGCTRGLGRAMIPVFIDAGWQVVRAEGPVRNPSLTVG